VELEEVLLVVNTVKKATFLINRVELKDSGYIGSVFRTLGFMGRGSYLWWLGSFVW